MNIKKYMTVVAILMILVANIKAEAAVRKVIVNVDTYGKETKECMIDNIIIEYSANVKLPQTAAKRKKLYSFKDKWYGGTRKIQAVYSNSKPQIKKNKKSSKGYL